MLSCILEVVQQRLRLLHSSFQHGPGSKGLERGYVVFVCAVTEQCADGSTENRCSKSSLSDLSAEFLASLSYTTKLLSESHMHGYLSKKLLLNITIVLRNVLYLSIRQLALCSCSSVLFAVRPARQRGLPWPRCAREQECEGRRERVWPLTEAAEENFLTLRRVRALIIAIR